MRVTAPPLGGHDSSGFIPFQPLGIGDLSIFARDVSGKKIILAQRSIGQATLIATQVSTQERNPAWDASLGEYTHTNRIEADYGLLKIDRVALAYADGFQHLSEKGPMQDQKLPLAVINDSEATLQGYGRGLVETVFFQPDGSLLHADWVFVKNQ